MSFKDFFSGHAGDYARFRPHYPRELFNYLAGITSEQESVWDCATGNGQAAVALAEVFRQVIATGASEKQIAKAQPHNRINYRVASAEQSGLPKESVDLVMVAQALHWLDRNVFFGEAKRILKPNGVLAVWSYNLVKIAPKIDGLVEIFYREAVGSFWDFERRLVETGYRSIAFPFEELSPPDFHMQAEWSLHDVLGYLRTSSATKGFHRCAQI